MGATLEPSFGGDIRDTVAESTPWWPRRPQRSSPNVVVVLLDDVGFSQLGSYGSSITTPSMDALATGGVSYTNFHVAALCSPTRASLLTGRNHHSVGVGFLGAFDTGYPNYRGAISPAAATIAEMLSPHGYSSYAVGKWHLTPPEQMSPAGPFDQWPTQRGFSRYYGFLWGEDDQWTPELWYDQHRVPVPDRSDYHFSEDIVDRAEEFLSDHVTNRPDDPFFCYVAFGACHAPHQAPRGYIDRYTGRFDHGWDVERRRILQRQIESGIVPSGTALPAANPGVPFWDELDPEERGLYARMQEAFAGFMEHTDDQVGRLMSFLRSRELLDDTLVIVMSDNGASGEGGRHGTINEYRYFLGLDDSFDDALAVVDHIGGPATHNQYPAGWAQAGNTPLRHYKKFAHGGGVRAPLIMHWPAGLPAGELRSQFHHVIDIVPTILDVTGVEAPSSHRGIDQLPVHGQSMKYTFDQPEAPSIRTRQYFETAGNRAIVSDGWKAVAHHRPGTPFSEDRWESFQLDADFSEADDLAASHPDHVRALERLWWTEASTYGVLPLDDRMGERVQGLDPAADRPSYTMLPGTRFLNHVVGPSFSERSFTVTARLRLHDQDEGVLLAYGRRAFGFTLFIQDGRLTFDYNLAGRHYILTSPTSIPTGERLLRLAVEKAEGGVTGRLMIDDEAVVETPLPRLVPGGIGTLSLQCGHNAPSAVSQAYQAPYTFTGDLHAVVIELSPRTSLADATTMAAELAVQ